jgi:hypothetical protein
MIKMKKLPLAILICFVALSASARQGIAGPAIPDTSGNKDLSSLLVLYYDIKNALVAGSAETAASKSGLFVKAAIGVDMKSISKKDREVFESLQKKLVFDATHISESKDIEHQREHFASFSLNMFELAKATKLTDQPVYEQYCPMKNNYWLSNETDIKNPYYGSMMLTCGRVVETIK